MPWGNFKGMQSTFLPDAAMLTLALTSFAGGSWVWCMLYNLLSSLPLMRDLFFFFNRWSANRIGVPDPFLPPGQ